MTINHSLVVPENRRQKYPTSGSKVGVVGSGDSKELSDQNSKEVCLVTVVAD